MTERRRLLGFLLLAGRGPLVIAGVVMALTAFMPVAAVLSAGVLVERMDAEVRAGHDDFGSIATPLLLLTVFIALAEMLNTALFTVGFWLSERVDGRIRSEIRLALAAPEGVSHLEIQGVRDAAGVASNGLYDSTIGLAAGAQLWRIWRMAGAAASTLLVGWFAPGIAFIVLIAMLAQRVVLTRQAKELVGVGAVTFPAFRGAQYWADVAGGPAAAKEVRVFGLDQWVIDRQRDYAISARQPIWDFLDKLIKRQWRLLGIALLGAVVGLGGLVTLAFQGHLTVSQLAIAIGGVLGMAQIAFPGIEALTIEVGRLCVMALTMLRSMSPGSSPGSATAVEPDDAPREEPRDAPTVRFEDIHFTYPTSRQPVLKGLDLEIRAGERLAIVGANGAGKTTLVRLLAGFYRPQQGAIIIDGTDLAERDLYGWRDQLAIVFQDFARFPLPARFNVTLSSSERVQDDTALESAAAAAALDDVVATLPNGWSTILSSGLPDGTDLSGGQWQRVALARGLLAVNTGCRMLVLDEPTAQIDVVAEADIFDRVLDGSHGATTVVISHRFSTIRRADRIVVLADGVIAEDGTHDELMERGGRYAAMYELQAASFRYDGGQVAAEQGGAP